jgi:hypothetical protein
MELQETLKDYEYLGWQRSIHNCEEIAAAKQAGYKTKMEYVRSPMRLVELICYIDEAKIYWKLDSSD